MTTARAPQRRIEVGEHVAAARDRVDLRAASRGTNGQFCRVNSRHVGPCRRSIAAAHATADSTVSHGRQRSMPGMRRRLAACSIDWCVGPSSPRPIESCVYTKIARSFISAAMRSALRA